MKQKGEYAGYDHGNNVCNGIAYDEAEKSFYVTGKRWNMMFKIKLDWSLKESANKKPSLNTLGRLHNKRLRLFCTPNWLTVVPLFSV